MPLPSNIAFDEIKRTSTYLHVRADVSGIEQAALGLGLTEKAIKRVERRAINKYGRWVRKEVLHVVGKEHQIRQKTLRQRFLIYRDYRAKILAVKVWFGVNPLAYELLGTPRQTRSGVRVGSRFIPHAFLASPSQFGHRPSKPGVYLRKGKERFPIYKPRLEIQDWVNAAIKKVLPKGHERFKAIFQQELKYELAKITGHA